MTNNTTHSVMLVVVAKGLAKVVQILHTAHMRRPCTQACVHTQHSHTRRMYKIPRFMIRHVTHPSMDLFIVQACEPHLFKLSVSTQRAAVAHLCKTAAKHTTHCTVLHCSSVVLRAGHPLSTTTSSQVPHYRIGSVLVCSRCYVIVMALLQTQ